MKNLELSALKIAIRCLIKEMVYGWPVETVIDSTTKNKNDNEFGDRRDPKNPNLRLPKGLNTRDKINL